MDKAKAHKSSLLIESIISKTGKVKKFKSLNSKTVNGRTIHVTKLKEGYFLVEESDCKLGYKKVIKNKFLKPINAINGLNFYIKENKFVIKDEIPSINVNSKLDDENIEAQGEDIDLDDENLNTNSNNEEIEAPSSEHQELTGKLAYILKDPNNEIDDYDSLAKYVFNTLLASLKISDLSEELLKSFKEKLTLEDEVNEDYLKELANKKGYVIVETFQNKSFLQNEEIITFNEDDEDDWEDYEPSITDKEVQYDIDKEKLPLYIKTNEDYEKYLSKDYITNDKI